MRDDLLRERAVRALRRELESRALDRATIDELVDHFESIVDERVAAGDELAAAIATARTRLGEPADLAREHARVRSPFGPRPSRLAAWSAVAALVAMSVISVADGGELRLAGFVEGPAVLRTVALLALVFRFPQAAAFLLGATASELVLWLGHGLHTGVIDGDARSTLLVVLLVGACAMLAVRRPSRWYVGTAALGWLFAATLINGHPAGSLIAHGVIPLLVAIAVVAIGVRARLARPVCAVLALVYIVPALVPMTRFVVDALPPVADWWRFDAASWWVAQVLGRVHGVITLAAPIVAVLLVRGDRSTRGVIADIRGRFAGGPDAPT